VQGAIKVQLNYVVQIISMCNAPIIVLEKIPVQSKLSAMSTDTTDLAETTIVEKDSVAVQKLFSSVIVSNGQSIAELSEHHRVVLFAIKFVGCPLCSVYP
jgi:hypothetical protein